MKKAILIANGESPSKKIINYFKSIGYGTIVCADGGANSAKKINLIPDIIVGDLDSISEKTLNFYKDKCLIIKISRQNDTDVEKALKYLTKKKFSEVILLGGTGDRLDHSFCNIGIVIKFYHKIKITLLHKNSLLRAYSGEIILTAQEGETLSLYGIDDKTKISSSGLKYPLKNISLPFGKKESTSNLAVSQNIKLKIDGGIILIIRDYHTMVKHGFI